MGFISSAVKTTMRKGVSRWIFAVFALLAATAANAQERGPGPSLDRILPQIRARHPGTFYDAEGPWRGPDGQLRYRLKWMMPGGRIVWFDADARTGRVLGPDRETRSGEPDRYRDDDDRGDDDGRWSRGEKYPRDKHGGGRRRGHR